MRTTPTLARQKLMELLRLTPEPHLREGYLMALRHLMDEYAQTILEKGNAAAEHAADLDQRRSREEQG